jgi:hypothetical protein
MIINIFIFIQKFIHVVIDFPYIKPTFYGLLYQLQN